MSSSPFSTWEVSEMESCGVSSVCVIEAVLRLRLRLLYLCQVQRLPIILMVVV